MDLVNKLFGILLREPLDLKQIDFIPTSCPETATDADTCRPFVIMEGCLGIPMDVAPSILENAWSQMLQYTKQYFEADDKSTKSHSILQHISRMSLCIVSINPDHHTAWNWRKRAIRKGAISCNNELSLLDLLVTYKRHCKSSLLWHHRRWIMETNKCDQRLQQLWEREREICQQSCERYPRNYHCWVYRWWCYNYTNHHLANNEMELELISQWIRDHPSDYAAAHYFHTLATTNASLDISVIYAELKHTTRSISSVYAAYEALWYHRRWCIGMLTQKDSKRGSSSKLSSKEIDFVNYIARQNPLDEQIKALAQHHKNWIQDNI